MYGPAPGPQKPRLLCWLYRVFTAVCVNFDFVSVGFRDIFQAGHLHLIFTVVTFPAQLIFYLVLIQGKVIHIPGPTYPYNMVLDVMLDLVFFYNFLIVTEYGLNFKALFVV